MDDYQMDYSLKLYLEDKYKKVEPTTFTSHKYSLIAFDKWVQNNTSPHKSLVYVDKSDLEKYIEHLSKENKNQDSTLENKQRIIRTFYSYLYQNKMIGANPVADWKKIKVDEKLPEFLTPEEIYKILEFAEGEREKVFILTLFFTGIRVSEFVNLRKNDINLDKGTMKIREKGGHERVVQMDVKLIKFLGDYIRYMDNDQKVFDYHTSTIQSDFRKLKKKAGITKKLTPHVMRHSFTVFLQDNEADLKDIQQLLGHKRLSSTERYLKLKTDDHLKNVVKGAFAGFEIR
ncbi:MAG: tyrosine-type recombinase/integrase [Methanocella sp.]